MCSIEEAWAGQSFEGHQVQSQADLHRKYTSITDNLLERNTEFSVGYNNPQPRTEGINTKTLRQPRVPENRKVNTNGMDIALSSVVEPASQYNGVPKYMNIYDTPTEHFNDINQAFAVSNVVDRFMNNGMNNNVLLNEDNNMDRMVVQNKFAKERSNTDINTYQNDIGVQLNEIIHRLDKLETKLNLTTNRNMCDITLYILFGIILIFIIYVLLRK